MSPLMNNGTSRHAANGLYLRRRIINGIAIAMATIAARPRM